MTRPNRQQVDVFGKRLKDERIRLGFGVCEFANMVGVDKSEISRAENNGRVPGLHIVAAMAKTLHCSIDYLAGLED
jgi:transcriptional regulator with XRE-family HTH domain